MQSPARAIALGLWLHHRRGLTVVAAYLSAAALVSAVAAPAGLAGEVAMQVGSFAGLPLMAALFYVIAVFAYGFEVDLAAPGTCFPKHMLTLPVGTAALAAWPVAFGTAALALLWAALAGLVMRPWGLPVPVVWPATLFAAVLAWIQAVNWWPFGLPWLRVAVGAVVVAVPIGVTIYAAQVGAPPALLVGFHGGCVALGLAAACAGVARARRGAVPSGDRLARAARALGRLRLRRGGFRSAAAAQTWFE